MAKTVFITGTSSGIGRQTAYVFQQNGWNVAATQRHPEKEKELDKLNNVKIYKVDVTNPQTIKNSIEKTKKEL